MLDERTITVSAFAMVPAKRRVRRVFTSLLILLVLLTIGTGAAYQALLSSTERTNLEQAAMLIGSDRRGALAKALRHHRPGARQP